MADARTANEMLQEAMGGLWAKLCGPELGRLGDALTDAMVGAEAAGLCIKELEAKELEQAARAERAEGRCGWLEASLRNLLPLIRDREPAKLDAIAALSTSTPGDGMSERERSKHCYCDACPEETSCNSCFNETAESLRLEREARERAENNLAACQQIMGDAVARIRRETLEEAADWVRLAYQRDWSQEWRVQVANGIKALATKAKEDGE